MKTAIKLFILILFNASIAFGLLFFIASSGQKVSQHVFMTYLLILHNNFLIFEMRWLLKGENSANFGNAFIVANSLHIFTPFLLHFGITYYVDLVFDIRMLFSSAYLKWYFLNGIIAGVYAFLYMRVGSKSYVKDKDILDEDYLN